MTQDEAPDEFDQPLPIVKPKPKPAPRNRMGLVAFIAAVASLAWGVFEYRSAALLTEELAQATAHNAQLQQQLTNQAQELKTVTAKLEELSRKNLPVAVLFRPSPSGTGLTTFFKNNAPSPIEIGVVLTNPITDRRREVNLLLPANGLQSIGEPEGWVFAPGHHIKVTHAQLGTVEYVVPEK